MIFLKRYRIELLLALLALLLIGNLVALFRKGPSTASNGPLIEAYDKAIAAKDQVIQLQERFREELRTEREKLQAKDSQLLLTLLSNQPKYQANEKKYNQIPAAVDGLDRSQLRREFTDY